jgi:hypothetical protein
MASPFLEAIGSAAENVVRGGSREVPGFDASVPPSKSGFAVRQSRVPSGRDAVHVRNMVRWFVPETGIVEMYVNPQGITYQSKKHINEIRTKGGYIAQYWGEQLGTLAINGTTGSSGIEGINVLEDVYRAEQLAFDPYALALESKREEESSTIFGDVNPNSILGLAADVTEDIGDMAVNILDSGSADATRQRPSLASLAFSVEMYWSGWVFRGWFTDFSVEEKADNLGLFDYRINFTYTQRRGWRPNFMPWHRSPTDGPSNTDPIYGRPYSYSSQHSTSAESGRIIADQPEGKLYDELLQSAKELVSPSALLLGIPGIF